MTAFSHKETLLALRNILLAVAGIPSARAWENTVFTPTPGTPYLEEEYVPATNTLLTITPGVTERTGMYVVKWYGLAGTGISAIRDGVDAVLAAFKAGSSSLMTSGLALRIQGNPAPESGQLIPLDAGFACVVISIHWRVDVS